MISTLSLVKKMKNLVYLENSPQSKESKDAQGTYWDRIMAYDQAFLSSLFI